jgi:hypothetical protein
MLALVPAPSTSRKRENRHPLLEGKGAHFFITGLIQRTKSPVLVRKGHVVHCQPLLSVQFRRNNLAPHSTKE